MGCVVALVSLPLTMFVRGWAVATLWNWFVPFAWPGAPALGIAPAIGLMLLVGATRHIRPTSPTDEEWVKANPKEALARAYRSCLAALLSPLLSVGLGYIIRFWIM